MLISGNTTRGQVDKFAVFMESTSTAKSRRDQKHGLTNYTNARKMVCQSSLGSFKEIIL